ncbi:MAG: zinc ribbon domain-containing protein [Acidimicrobiales bacterium]
MSATGWDARGRRGFGHSQDRRQVMAAEAQLIREAARRVLGGDTLVSIVADWNAAGVTTTTGGPWRINALSALLIQPRLAGLGPTGEEGAFPVPAIVDRATHERLLDLRRARCKEAAAAPGTGGGERVPRRYLLSGFLRCWRCGARLGGAARSTSSAQPCYRCPSRGAGGCSGVVIPASAAEAAATDLVLARVDDASFVAAVVARAARLVEQEHHLAALVTSAVTGTGTGGGVDGMWAGGSQIDDDAWQRLRRQLEDRARTTDAGVGDQALLRRQRELCGAGSALRRAWDDMGLDERRATLAAVIDHFVVLAARRRSGAAGAPVAAPAQGRGVPGRLSPVWRD